MVYIQKTLPSCQFLRHTTFGVLLYCWMLGILILTDSASWAVCCGWQECQHRQYPAAQPHWEHSIMDKSALMSSIWTSATQAEVAPSPCHGPRSEQWRREEKPGLFLPLLHLLLEWTNNSTSLACCSEVFLKHQIHTEKINNSPVITHPIAISYPFIYYTPSKRYRARKQIKAWALAHHKL